MFFLHKWRVNIQSIHTVGSFVSAPARATRSQTTIVPEGCCCFASTPSTRSPSHHGDTYQECQRGLVAAFCVNRRSGEGQRRSKGQDQQVNTPSLCTQPSAVTLESSALTAQRSDQGRRVSITTVTAEHPGSAAATAPPDTDNISATLLTLCQETNTTGMQVDGAAAAAVG